MAKLSVSVPDHLWSAVRAASPNLNPSELVQTALRGSLDRTPNRPPFAITPPDVSGDLLARAVSRLRKEARELYVSGFQAGLKLGETLSWRALDRLSDADWKLDGWFQELAANDEVAGEGVFESVAGERWDYWPAPTFRLGLVDALKALWDATAAESSPPVKHGIPSVRKESAND